MFNALMLLWYILLLCRALLIYFNSVVFIRWEDVLLLWQHPFFFFGRINPGNEFVNLKLLFSLAYICLRGVCVRVNEGKAATTRFP